MTGPSWGLLGSGEFEPWSRAVDTWLLERAGPGPVLILPTASSREGAEVFDRWGAKGMAHFAGAGIESEVVPIVDRADADRPQIVERLDGAAMVYFSGGNPWYLAEALRGSAFYARMLERISEGMAYAGCSAGVACLAEKTFDSDTEDFSEVFKPGLGLFRRVLFGPHWNMLDTWIPGATDFIVASVGEGETFFGIDEDTAMVGDGDSWQVLGAGSVHVRTAGEWTQHAGGDSFRLTLDIGEAT